MWERAFGYLPRYQVQSMTFVILQVCACFLFFLPSSKIFPRVCSSHGAFILIIFLNFTQQRLDNCYDAIICRTHQAYMIVLVSSYELLDTYTVIWWHLYYCDITFHLDMIAWLQTCKTIGHLVSKPKHQNMDFMVHPFRLRVSISLEAKRKLC